MIIGMHKHSCRALIHFKLAFWFHATLRSIAEIVVNVVYLSICTIVLWKTKLRSLTTHLFIESIVFL